MGPEALVGGLRAPARALRLRPALCGLALRARPRLQLLRGDSAAGSPRERNPHPALRDHERGRPVWNSLRATTLRPNSTRQGLAGFCY